jgi:putative aldouronate transport system substrate-binding protein
MIRQDWLDKLGLKVPETTEDLYKVLIAFRDMDPNGNGKKDEVPVAFNYASYTWYYMMYSFGLNVSQPFDFLGKDKEGKFYTYLTRPEFKETMGYLSKLYTEKLMNQDILNVSNDSYMKLITENRVGVLFYSLNPDIVTKIKAANPDADPRWTVMLPPKGPRGDMGVRSYNNLDGQFFISKKGNVEDATKFMDYTFADPVGGTLINWGIKGSSYTEENGVKQSTDFVLKNPEGLTPTDALYSIGVLPTLAKIRDVNAHPKMEELRYQEHPWILAGSKLYSQTAGVRGEPEKKYRFTTEESGKIKEIHTQLDTYISETLAKVLVGNKPIDEMDNFSKTLKEKGIDQIAEIFQRIDNRSK